MFIVMSASAKMSASVRARYRRVAVCEVKDNTIPARISDRSRGMVRIVKRWERCHVGKTPRGCYQRALAEAESLAIQLNARN